VAISDAAIDPKTLTAARGTRLAVGDLRTIDERSRSSSKAIHALIARLPAHLREQVIKKTLAASRAIRDSNGHAHALVNLVRHVDRELHVEAHDEALARLQAIEERKSGSGYEETLLEFIYQESAEYVPALLNVVRAGPDSR